MANRSSAPGRIALMGLVVAGALAGTAGAAGAQYYYYDEDPYPAYGYGYRYDYGYAPRPPRAVPRAPAAVSPYTVNRIAARNYGLVRIDRSIRRDDTYVVDGITAGGQRQRLVLDAYAGELIRRIPLRGQSVPAPDVARVDPREEHVAPRPRLAPQPPERPAELKPPAEASAPATVSPPSPAAPPVPEPAKPVERPPAEASAPATVSPPSPAAPPVPEPAKPAEKPPAEASAPATVAPPPVVRPPQPSPGATNPETGADKPRLVNPSDVRGTEDGERKPPLSTAAPAPEALSMPPVQHVDPTPTTPKPETPIAPVAPLN
ncbi:hypothetical protein [Bosea sp. NBC_00550]|uniref:hypothetical protein n=1 Tax=Bosea sp. NBC_00550 TaxID=2969621 RepID=UPI002231B173|nr:hypothetical protein [Bosea sp. NBC_00550]UZF95402.1 hypothetical protein NWE53_14495 [Bosea sp. NBC_00550]